MRTPHRPCERSVGCKERKGGDAMLEYIPYIFYGLLAIGVIYILITKLRIKRNGTETEAVVSRIDSQESRNDDGSYVSTDYYIVTYKSEVWQTMEATLINPPTGLKVGSRVKIKYSPDKPKMAVVTELIDK